MDPSRNLGRIILKSDLGERRDIADEPGEVDEMDAEVVAQVIDQAPEDEAVRQERIDEHQVLFRGRGHRSAPEKPSLLAQREREVNPRPEAGGRTVFWPGEKKKKPYGIEEDDRIDDPGQSGQRDEERGSHQRPDKGAEEVEAIAAAKIRSDTKIKPIGDDKQGAAEDSKENQDEKSEDLGKLCRNGQAEKTEKKQKPDLDGRQPSDGRAADPGAQEGAQKQPEHETGKQQGDSPVEKAIERLEPDEEDDLRHDRRQTHYGQGEQAVYGLSFSSAQDREEQDEEKERQPEKPGH